MRRLLATLLLMALAASACGRSAPDTADPTTTTVASTAAGSTPGSTASTDGSLAEAFGAAGVGDPYFPELGNGGYDVSHYDIAVTVDPETAEIEATTTITATATESLGTFNLDLLGLDISALSVDGAPATFVREGPELRISPHGGIVAGEEFSVVVSYAGLPQPIDLPSIGIEFGWTQTDEEIYVAAEPDAARTWFPSNDHPSDKATFTFHITVPKPLTGAANGRLVEVIDNGENQTWVWELESPMATYLATIVVGDYERIESEGPNGIVLRDYIPASLEGQVPPTFGVTAEAIEVFSDWFGPYPFDRYGHIVVHELGGALETQTLTLIGDRALFDDVVVHELTHMWFGDAVSPATWQDIWLNEGFATFGEFLWREHREGRAAMLHRIETLHTTLSTIEHRPISDPTEDELFGPAVYWRGGMTLFALREALGDDAVMRQILQTYFARYRDGNASTDDFIAVVTEVSGRDFTDLWNAWLYSSELPDLP